MSTQQDRKMNSSVTKTPAKRRTSKPRTTRTNKDWIMIVMGTLLAVSFLIGLFVSFSDRNKSTRKKKHGPVRDPKKLEQQSKYQPFSSSDVRQLKTKKLEKRSRMEARLMG